MEEWEAERNVKEECGNVGLSGEGMPFDLSELFVCMRWPLI